jgi:hypothetical protein
MAALASATVVALAVNETPSVPFGTAWTEAKRIGIRATTLSVDWAQAEPRPGEYDLTWPRAAGAFYPAEGAEIGLVLRDLNTTRDERPPICGGSRTTIRPCSNGGAKWRTPCWRRCRKLT